MGVSAEYLDHVAQDVLQRGYSIREDVVDEAYLQRLEGEIADIRDREPPARKTADETGSPGSASHRIRNLVCRSSLFRESACFSPVCKTAERLLGPGYLVFASAINDVGPGELPQRLHTDDILIELPRPFPRPLILNAIWAITDFTAENGATRLFAGSHLRSELRPPDTGPTIATMRRGSVLVYHGSLWHGAGGNTTRDQRRVGMVFTYCARFIRPYENQLKLIPLEEARSMSAELRQLIGFDYAIEAQLRR
jgi:ectoine hydroxylase-related dioxygenase (phytanoyl-CoA dioxygenase family)